MKIISHRGNLHGPNTAKFGENHPDSIMYVLYNTNFDIEIDVWRIDKGYWLGHDSPEYYIGSRFGSWNLMQEIFKNGRCWLHTKNPAALFDLSNDVTIEPNFFWHDKDDYTLTNHKVIWTYPDKIISGSSDNQVIVDHSRKKLPQNLYGICTDYPLEQKEIQNQCQS